MIVWKNFDWRAWLAYGAVYSSVSAVGKQYIHIARDMLVLQYTKKGTRYKYNINDGTESQLYHTSIITSHYDILHCL